MTHSTGGVLGPAEIDLAMCRTCSNAEKVASWTSCCMVGRYESSSKERVGHIVSQTTGIVPVHHNRATVEFSPSIRGYSNKTQLRSTCWTTYTVRTLEALRLRVAPRKTLRWKQGSAERWKLIEERSKNLGKRHDYVP